MEIGYADATILNESRKRTFGTDVTNISFKRGRLDPQTVGDTSQNFNMHKQTKVDDLVNEVDKSNSENSGKQGATSYQFGPFAPSNVLEVDASKKVKQEYDWENLASVHRPQYHNQGIMFLHCSFL